VKGDLADQRGLRDAGSSIEAANLLARGGGVAAIVASVGLGISLVLRHVTYLKVDLLILAVAGIAGLQAIRASRRPDAEGLVLADVLLFVAMIPMVFGWTVLFYIPSLVAFLAATALHLTRGT
jgi:hypothetical protein